MTAIISQGFTYLCGCFASVISTTKAVSGLKHLSKEYQRELLNVIYINLENCGRLLSVHLTGTENSLLLPSDKSHEKEAKKLAFPNDFWICIVII